MRLCCAKDSASAAQPCQRGPGAASTASTPGALVFVARRRRSAERDEAQRHSTWANCVNVFLGLFGIRASPRSIGSAPARSGSEPSFSSTCPSPPSLPRRASEALQDDGDAAPARRELSDAEAWSFVEEFVR